MVVKLNDKRYKLFALDECACVTIKLNDKEGLVNAPEKKPV